MNKDKMKTFFIDTFCPLMYYSKANVKNVFTFLLQQVFVNKS